MIKTTSLPVLMIFLLLFFMCSANSESHNNQYFLDQFVQYQEFQNWYKFWNDSFPDVDLEKLNFNHKNSLILNSGQLSSDRVQELTDRNFTLNYNKTGNFAVDLYYDVTFIYDPENRSVIVRGRDVDPAFMIYDFNNTHACYYTLGSTTFYDESVWTSDTSFAIFGVNFWPVQDSFQNLLVIKGSIRGDTIVLDIYLSEKIPWISSWSEYMGYKYPNIVFGFKSKK